MGLTWKILLGKCKKTVLGVKECRANFDHANSCAKYWRKIIFYEMGRGEAEKRFYYGQTKGMQIAKTVA